MAEEGSSGTPSPAGPPGSERRAAPRHVSSTKITCYPAGAGLGERRQARLRNVSRNGIALVADRRWEPGAVLVIELPPTEDGPTTTTKARIVHATPQPGGCFLVGCVLDIALTDAQVQALMG